MGLFTGIVDRPRRKVGRRLRANAAKETAPSQAHIASGRDRTTREKRKKLNLGDGDKGWSWGQIAKGRDRPGTQKSIRTEARD